MKQALFYKKLKNKIVQCQLCPHFCSLKEGEKGKCGVRENQNGKLMNLVYNHPCSLVLDPIEKKPLYHFLPGEESLSIATVGCNLACQHCQNYDISQAKSISIKEVKAEEVIKEAKDKGVKIIAYTFTEPTIFYEYMLEIAKLAKKSEIKNIIVSNGFINPEPLRELCKYIGGANIDLKSISDDFYKKICRARVKPVLESLKILKQENVWIEITNLLIPGLNDSNGDIKKLVDWVKDNLGLEIPIHFTAFYPTHKLTHLPRTSLSTLKRARGLALDAGIKYVYTGNLPDEEGNCTFCPKCKKLLIKRSWFSITENNLKKGKCPSCNEKIDGVWN